MRSSRRITISINMNKIYPLSTIYTSPTIYSLNYLICVIITTITICGTTSLHVLLSYGTQMIQDELYEHHYCDWLNPKIEKNKNKMTINVTLKTTWPIFFPLIARNCRLRWRAFNTSGEGEKLCNAMYKHTPTPKKRKNIYIYILVVLSRVFHCTWLSPCNACDNKSCVTFSLMTINYQEVVRECTHTHIYKL